MLLIPISLFFFWLIYRELTSEKEQSKTYLAVLLLFALSSAWPPYHYWYFARNLTKIALVLAENHPAKVHCNTLFDTLFDEDIGVAGHADPKTGYIVIQYPRCSMLMDYLAHPERADKDQIITLNVLEHEKRRKKLEQCTEKDLAPLIAIIIDDLQNVPNFDVKP